jgi:glycosyltransferase involved in cell wall biosynthesis
MNPPSLNRYIPGKIYEYIAAGTPILLYGEGGEMAKIVEDLCAGQIVSAGNENALTQAIEALATRPHGRDTKCNAWLETRTRQFLANKMLVTLDCLVTGVTRPQ